MEVNQVRETHVSVIQVDFPVNYGVINGFYQNLLLFFEGWTVIKVIFI